MVLSLAFENQGHPVLDKIRKFKGHGAAHMTNVLKIVTGPHASPILYMAPENPEDSFP